MYGDKGNWTTEKSELRPMDELGRDGITDRRYTNSKLIENGLKVVVNSVINMDTVLIKYLVYKSMSKK